MLRGLFFLTFLMVGVFTATASPIFAALSTTPNEILPSSNYSISQVTAGPNDTYFVGGSFTFFGDYSPVLTKFDLTTGVRDTTLVTSNEMPSVIVPDGSGGYFIGGNFASVGGVAKRDVAHINANGTLDSGWTADTNNSGVVHIRDMEVANGVLYLCGNFASINGTTRANLAAVNLSNGSVTSWNPTGSGVCSDIEFNTNRSIIFVASADRVRSYNTGSNSSVRTYTVANNGASTGTVSTVALSSDDSILYVGGSFTRFGATNRNDLAAFQTSDGAITSWNPDSIGVDVNKVIVDGSTIYTAGWFDTVNGNVSRNNAAAYDTSGVVTAWNPNLTGNLGISGQNWTEAIGMEIYGNDVYLFGDFTSVGGTERFAMAVVDKDSAAVGSFNIGFDARVYSVLKDGNSLLIGGSYKNTKVTYRRSLAQFDRGTNQLTSWNPQLNGTVQDMYFDGINTLYVAGFFSSVGGTTRNNFAAINATTGQATSLDPNINSTVTRIMPNTSEKMFVAGNFSTVGGVTRSGLAEINLSDGSLTTFNPIIAGQYYYVVNDMAMYGSDLYVVGDFNSVNGGTTRRSAAAFNLETGVASAWDPSFGEFQGASEIEIIGNHAYLSGSFSQINTNVSRPNLAQVDLVNGIVTSWDAQVNGSVYDLLFANNALYLGGNFSTVNNGVSRNRLAAVDITNAALLPWAPAIANVASTTVFEINPVGTELFVGGDFHIDPAGDSYITGLTSFSGWNVPPTAPGNAGPSSVTNGSSSSNNQPTFTFEIEDDNSGDEVRYRIVIDTNPDFSSPVVEYTSALAPTGQQTFTVGQPLGSGTYSEGEENQQLPPGSYYWQVQGIDEEGNEGEYAAANNGSVAFIVNSGNTEAGNTDGGNTSGQSSSNSSNSGSSGPRFCSDWVPMGQPDLFQINRTGASAKLYFTPVNDNVRNYHVVYGYKEGEERFGLLSANVTSEANNGVQSLTINELDPKIVYWFKVAPVNNCAVGTWSNWLKADRSAAKTSIFYRYLPEIVRRAIY